MHHVMFDIDGTLVDTYDLDFSLFVDAVQTITGADIDTDLSKYRNVTDSGILDEFFELNGILNKQETESKVKEVFIEKLGLAIASVPVREIPGAADFLGQLHSMSDVVVSFATGGWYESAVMKLRSAGIDFSAIPIASANDSMSRVEIMKISASRATGGSNFPCTYFGDAIWDKKASEQLGYNFILVGNKIEYKNRITCYTPPDEALKYIGL